MSNIPFEGMTKVTSYKVNRVSQAVILYIERSRNNLFQEAVNEELENPWHYLPLFVDVAKLPKSVIFNPWKWFTRIPILRSLEEVKGSIRSYRTSPHCNFMEKELMVARTMLELVHDNDVYITPLQGRLINRYQEGDYRKPIGE